MSEGKDISEDAIRAGAPLLFESEPQKLEAPEGYLEGLEEKILNSIQESNTYSMKQKKNPILWWKWAAVFALLLTAFGLWFSIQEAPQGEGQELADDWAPYLEIEEDIIYEVYAEIAQEEEDIIIDYLMEEELELNELYIQ